MSSLRPWRWAVAALSLFTAQGETQLLAPSSSNGATGHRILSHRKNLERGTANISTEPEPPRRTR
jgi:hypothetical protein